MAVHRGSDPGVALRGGRRVTGLRLVPLLAGLALPMLVTLSGIVTLVRLLQLAKAHNPMRVTLSGIVTLVRLVHFQKAQLPMLVTGFPS